MYGTRKISKIRFFYASYRLLSKGVISLCGCLLQPEELEIDPVFIVPVDPVTS